MLFRFYYLRYTEAMRDSYADGREKLSAALLLKLFAVFFKIGLFTFGGGLAMLPLLTEELSIKRAWTSRDELLDYFAIGQCTPGIIAVNVATFCGYKRAGLSGAIVSTIGIVCPSWIVITLIAGSISRFSDIVWIQRAMKGVYVAVAALLARAVFTFGKKIITDFVTALVTAVIAVAAFFAMSVWNVSGILIVLAAGIIGFCAQIIRNGKRASGRRKEDKE